MDIQLLALKIVRRIRKVGLWATLRQTLDFKGSGAPQARRYKGRVRRQIWHRYKRIGGAVEI